MWKSVRAPTEGEDGSDSAEYMHIGATITRFLSVTERIVSGRKRVGVPLAAGFIAAPGLVAGVK
jgi:hypothetical protein